MKEQARCLVQATQALISYIEENQVYDKLADGGCGLYDTYRSDRFEEAIQNARLAAQEMEKLLQEAP
uniref:HEPN domain-containing protein n=1 Tax=Desulfobacca acetoxidans TaxID=60893 RepID=A0A7C5ELZ3_9BACT